VRTFLVQHGGRLVRYWGRDFWLDEVWARERLGPASSAGRRAATMLARCLFIVLTGFRAEKIKLRASALTYMTLLSLVPALAVVFSLFTAFGGLEDVGGLVRNFVIDALAVGSREKVIEQLETFVAQAHAARIGGIGTALLLFTVVSLLTNVEKAFNDIWGVTRDRTLFQRFQVYWPLVTLGPILLGLSLSMTAAVAASDVVTRLSQAMPVAGMVTALGPLVLTIAFFALAYAVIPNTRVHPGAALIGGAIAGSLWVLAQKLYALYAANAITYSAIYGSLGAVPLFIIWIYVSWTVALLGATITFAVQSAATYDPGSEHSLSPRERERTAARLVMAVAESFALGRGAVSAEALFELTGARPRAGRQLLGQLVAAGILAETSPEERRRDVGYLPGRPLDALTLADVVLVVRSGKARAPVGASATSAVEAVLSEAEGAARGLLAAHTLAELTGKGAGAPER
jgi:membrane protein